MTIVYRLGSKLYLNITNDCSCSCVFCIRNNTDGVGDAASLWLEREPTLEEIKAALIASLSNRDDTHDNASLPHDTLTMGTASSGVSYPSHDIDEIVFCGYGEPMLRADVVIEVAQYIKDNFSSFYRKPAPPVRINTNGLAFLMCPGFDVSRLSVVDTVSISLNADDAEEYQRLARPRYGVGAFDSLLDFAREASAYTSVVFSVVEGTLSAERMENCWRIAGEMGIPLRVRGME